MKKVLKICIFITLFLNGASIVSSQELTMEDAIRVAREQSVSALEARYDFISSYWAYRSYKASLLPSLTLYGEAGNFTRAQTLVQDYETGNVKYAWTNNLQNSLGLSVMQPISFTGGSISLYSNMSRVDQYGGGKNMSWYSQPMIVSYSQPLFAYNSFKWSKAISPKEYEKARRIYIETMEKLSGDVVCAFFNLALASMRLDVAATNYENAAEMFRIAQTRLSLGSIKKDECLQLELRMLNDSISINENTVAMREAQMALNSLLGCDETSEITPLMDEKVPDLAIDYEFVVDKAHENSSFDLENDISILYAQSAVAQAKASRGLTMQLNARFGLSKTDRAFSEMFTGLANQEIVGLSFSIPIYDWGLGRGKIQKAKAAEEVVRAQIEQSENDFRREIFTKVGKFNNLHGQCASSRRAREIASERYRLTMDSFRNGTATVTELNTAQSECDSATNQYVTDICDYWVSYYALRQLTLFDFLKGKDIDVNPEEMLYVEYEKKN